MYKVSVIIPVYNSEKYLHECLNSVINQTLKDIEIICINDGSIDNSEQIIEEYKKSYNNIKLINQKNLGVAKSRNVGKECASGKYIFYLDSDDYIENNLLEKCFEQCEAYNLDIAMFDSKNVYENTKVKTSKEIERYYVISDKIVSGEQSFNLMVENDVCGWWTCCIHFFKKEFLESNNLRFDESIMHEDIVYISKSMLLAKRVKHIGESLYNYRRRDNSRSCKNKSGESIMGHYLSANSLSQIMANSKFKEDKTYDNLLKFIKYFYKRSILDCDRILNLQKRNEIYRYINKYTHDIELSMQKNSPNLFYSSIQIK